MTFIEYFDVKKSIIFLFLSWHYYKLSMIIMQVEDNKDYVIRSSLKWDRDELRMELSGYPTRQRKQDRSNLIF